MWIPKHSFEHMTPKMPLYGDMIMDMDVTYTETLRLLWNREQ